MKKTAAGFLREDDIHEGVGTLPVLGEVARQAAKLGFSVEGTEVFRESIELRSLEQLWDIGLQEGWFAQYLALVSPEQMTLIRSLEASLFPLGDEVEVDIVLLRKPRT